MRHFVGLFLALTLTVPTPAFALRTPERVEAKGGLEELESALRNPSDPGRAAAKVLGRQLATTLGIPAAQRVPVPAAGLEEHYRIVSRLERTVSADKTEEVSAGPGQLFLVHVTSLFGRPAFGYYLVRPEAGVLGPVVSVLVSTSGAFGVDSEGGMVMVDSWRDAETQSKVELVDKGMLAVEWHGSEKERKLRFTQESRYSGLRYDVYGLTAQPAGLEQGGQNPTVEERNPTEAYGIIQGLRTQGLVVVGFPSPRLSFSDSILLDPLEGPLNLGRVDLEQSSIRLRRALTRFADPVSGRVKFRVETGRDRIVVTLLRPDTGTRVTDPPGGGPFRRPGPSSGPGEIQERLPIPPGVDDRSSRSRIGGPASDEREPDDIEVPVGQQVPAAGLEAIISWESRRTPHLLDTLEKLTQAELLLFLASLGPAGGLILDATLRKKESGARELIVSA